MMKKLKINDVAKDLHLTTQELIAFYETRSSDGQKKKSGSSLTPEEVNLALGILPSSIRFPILTPILPAGIPLGLRRNRHKKKNL